MRMQWGWGVVAGLLLAVGLMGPSAPAGADPAPTETEVYDLRIVRVETPVPEGIEAPCPILTGAETTTSASWPDLLAAVKKRGRARILLDRRITSAPGQLAKAYEERQVPIIAPQSRTREADGAVRENLAAARYRSGCKLDLVTSQRPDGVWLGYKVEVRGVLEAMSKEATAATETLHTWEGGHRSFTGRTFVLTHREQVQDPGDAAARGVELYCFVTMR